MKKTCDHCRGPLPKNPLPYRNARFCSEDCKRGYLRKLPKKRPPARPKA